MQMWYFLRISLILVHCLGWCYILTPVNFNPSKIEWDLTTGPRSVSCETELLDTQVCSGSVKRGSCWRFLGFKYFSNTLPETNVAPENRPPQ